MMIVINRSLVTNKRKYLVPKFYSCIVLLVFFCSGVVFGFVSSFLAHFSPSYFGKDKDYRTLLSSGSPKINNASNDHVRTGVTGTLFIDDKARIYHGHRYFSSPVAPETSTSVRRSSIFPYHGKYNYGIVTTVHNVSQAIQAFIRYQLPNDWRLIIVHDILTPSDYLYQLQQLLDQPPNRNHPSNDVLSTNIINLDTVQQRALRQQYPSFMDRLPWNHFGRKNIGYLYALLHNASIIFDFDDDNVLLQPLDNLWNNNATTNSLTSVRQLHRNDEEFTKNGTVECPVLNIYSLFPTDIPVTKYSSPPQSLWPRGYPLLCLRSMNNSNAPSTVIRYTTLPNVSLPSSSLGIIQSLANIEPDVDSIYRLTRTLPITFRSSTLLYVLPSGTYTPYNAQSTLIRFPALWTVLLPISVHGRVSDIWRSYITQRLLQDTDITIGISSSFVNQYRNQHNPLADMQAEEDIFYKGLQLVQRLYRWQGNSTTLPGRYEELLIELYERTYIEIDDVYLGQEWLRILTETIHYPFPELRMVNSIDKMTKEENDEELRLPVVEPSYPSLPIPSPPDPLPSLLPTPSSSSVFPYPTLSLQVRTYGPRLKELWMTLIPSYLLFVPWQEWTNLDFTIVWDGESVGDHYAATLLSNLPPYPRMIFENVPPINTLVEWGNRGIGYSRQQYSNFYMDHYTAAETIGMMDSDTQFVYPLTPNYLFRSETINDHRSVILKPIQIGLGFNSTAHPYQPWAIGVKLAIGHPKVIQRMLVSGFPVLIKRHHLRFLRQHMIRTTRSRTFEEAFRKVSIGNADYDTLCQFDIMVNYLWYYHRNEYSWHIKDPLANPVPYTHLTEASTDPDVRKYHNDPEFMINKNGGHDQETFPFLADFLCLVSNYTTGSCPEEYRKQRLTKEWEESIVTNLRMDTWIPLHRWYERGYRTNLSAFTNSVPIGREDTPWTSTKESWKDTWLRHQEYYQYFRNTSATAFRWKNYDTKLREPWKEKEE